MFKTHCKRIRELIAGTLLLASGIFIGYQLSERERIQTGTYLVVDEIASELMTDAAILQNLKLDRPSCARWLLEVRVNSASKTLETFRVNPDVPTFIMDRLEQAVKSGKTALSSEDKSNLNAEKTCTQ